MKNKITIATYRMKRESVEHASDQLPCVSVSHEMRCALVDGGGGGGGGKDIKATYIYFKLIDRLNFLKVLLQRQNEI